MALIDYSPDKLSIRPAHTAPVIRIYQTGTFYLYKSLLKRIGASEKGSKVLFSHDPLKNLWYISLDNDKGLPIRYSDTQSYHYVNSSVLRDRLLTSQIAILQQYDEDQTFYMRAELAPTKIDNSGKKYFRIDLIL
jgi:hypothetical protein